MQFLFYLNPKFQASSHLVWLYSLVCVRPGRKPRRPVFSERGSLYLEPFSDTARIQLETAKGTTVPNCYTFVTEYDEEATNLPYWMKSIGSKFTMSCYTCFQYVTMTENLSSGFPTIYVAKTKALISCAVPICKNIMIISACMTLNG